MREQPTPEAPVVGVLAAKPSGEELQRAAVTLTASQSGWARITLAKAEGYTALEGGTPRQYGWVPADMLAVNTRVDGAITTYSRPGLMGTATGHIENESDQFRVLGCRGEWLQVINEARGNTWIDRWCARAEGCRKG